jgi:hypothetical protein
MSTLTLEYWRQKIIKAHRAFEQTSAETIAVLVALVDKLEVLGSPRRFVESAIWLLIVRSQ